MELDAEFYDVPWAERPVAERLALKFLMGSNEKNRVEVTLPAVVVQGHEVEAEFLPKQPKEIRALLESQGREVATRHSQIVVEGVPFKTGKRVGEVRPDKFIDCYGLATLDKAYPVVYAFWFGSDSMLFARIRWADHTETRITLVSKLKSVLGEAHGLESEVDSEEGP